MTQTIQRPSAPPALETNDKAPHAHHTWSAGDVAHQGDLVFIALASLPESAKPRKDRQLAEGDTKGSRHIVRGGEVYDAAPSDLQKHIKNACGKEIDERYIGPVFSGACTVEHPEHAHQVFPDHAATAVVFQRNLSAEEFEERVRD